jgi:UDPglucose 6-dehydrogenase
MSVVEALKSDPRIGRRAFLSPGFGFAGGTLARDVQVLREIGKREGIDAPLLSGTLAVNQSRPAVLVHRLQRMYGDVRGLNIGVLGLTYKAGTSTLRRSVALSIIKLLTEAGAKVRAYDPKADLSELDGPADFEVVADAYEAATGASALALLTEWPEFAALDFDRIKSVMAKPVIFDGKNLLANLKLADKGFIYQGIGR